MLISKARLEAHDLLNINRIGPNLVEIFLPRTKNIEGVGEDRSPKIKIQHIGFVCYDFLKMANSRIFDTFDLNFLKNLKKIGNQNVGHWLL